MERQTLRTDGHEVGVQRVEEIIQAAQEKGIRYLTLYAFSSENWLRPKTEVRSLMALLKRYLAHETSRMMTNNIRFNVIGDRRELPEDVNRAVQDAIEAGRKYMRAGSADLFGGNS